MCVPERQEKFLKNQKKIPKNTYAKVNTIISKIKPKDLTLLVYTCIIKVIYTELNSFLGVETVLVI